MRKLSFLMSGVCMLVCLGAGAEQAPVQGVSQAVTVPMQLELNRPYIDVTLVGPNGKDVHARTWIDTGGGAIVLSAGLAHRLGLKATGAVNRDEGDPMAPVGVPALRIGGTPIELVDARAVIAVSVPEKLFNTDAEMGLPARMLRNHVVVFDYPAHTFTIAKAGQLRPAGTPVKAYIGDSGMPEVWLAVAGQMHGFLLDTGGQYSMVSDAAMHGWMKQNPGWAHAAGAYGPANMLIRGEEKLEMLRIGEMDWGPFHIENAGVISRRPGTYEKFMSGILGKPIIGSIGGNVLRDFRVTIDYPAGKVYLRRRPSAQPEALDTIGITLRRSPQGGYDIAGVATDVPSIQPGDHLLTIDGHDVGALYYSRIEQLLGGQPGATRALGLTRDGKPLLVKATVRSVF